MELRVSSLELCASRASIYSGTVYCRMLLEAVCEVARWLALRPLFSLLAFNPMASAKLVSTVWRS